MAGKDILEIYQSCPPTTSDPHAFPWILISLTTTYILWYMHHPSPFNVESTPHQLHT